MGGCVSDMLHVRRSDDLHVSRFEKRVWDWNGSVAPKHMWDFLVDGWVETKAGLKGCWAQSKKCTFEFKFLQLFPAFHSVRHVCNLKGVWWWPSIFKVKNVGSIPGLLSFVGLLFSLYMSRLQKPSPKYKVKSYIVQSIHSIIDQIIIR